MKRLILMRHAKSSWKQEGVDDHERPLNARGQRDAPRVAARLAELGWRPERVVLSDARRTRETWALMAGPLGRPPAVETRRLYLAGLGAIRQEARALPDEVGSALLLGHNPGWEEAASALSGDAVGMTTANAALLESGAATWAEALAGPWRLVALIRPKDLPGADPQDDDD